jgi:hypothetical protein
MAFDRDQMKAAATALTRGGVFIGMNPFAAPPRLRAS